MPEARVAERIDEPEAGRLALELYGLRGPARALPGEYDDNFHVAPGDEPGIVLKVLHPAREESLVDLQCAALRHLERRAPELAVPRVRSTLAGADVGRFRDGAGRERLVFALGYRAGRVLAEARPRTAGLLRDLGRLLGRLDGALADFSHPAARRELKWDCERTPWIRAHLAEIESAGRALVERALAAFDAEVAPRLPGLRRGVIYGDANDYNVIVGDARREPRELALIDFGDMHHGLIVGEPAVAAAYALLGQDDPLDAALALAAGYHEAFPLAEEEIALLHPLIAARLAVSVVNSAHRKTLVPDDPYVTVSEEPAWRGLEKLLACPPRLAHCRFRAACGLPALPGAPAVTAWLGRAAARAAPLLEADLRHEPVAVLDLGVGSLLLGADPAAAELGRLTRTIFGEMESVGARVGIGRYDEARALYGSELFAGPGGALAERRTVHLGVDLFVEAGAEVRAPLSGEVHLIANNRAPLDYGPLVVLRHATDDGTAFFTLFGHLDEGSIEGLSVGQAVATGERFARVGSPPGNGGWPPHVHFQLVLDLLGLGADFPGVAFASQRGLWKTLCPDPGPLLGLSGAAAPGVPGDSTGLLARRRERLGGNLSLSYRRPIRAARAFRQYLYDADGRAYLDAYNNVPLVGHGHPRVVEAARRQLALLNTNTRYLHEGAVRYAERLGGLLGGQLQVCYFVSSGSEANELALRLARAATGHDDVIVIEHAYHGNTTTLVDVSPYKFAGPGGSGRRPWVHVAPLPDDYRGPYRRDDPAAGARYAAAVAEIVEGLRAKGRGPAAFLAETLPSVAGQVVPPPGYLAAAYRHVRSAGGVCIADEVQTGFARLGSHFWGFALQGAVPDIVVLGKPIANGFPLGAVVTTPEIAAAFDNGMEFFSTFGGNPVACAAGLAVLDVLEEEGLQENAARVGGRLAEGLRGLAERHRLIGDVRGVGLYLGVDLVEQRETRRPAARQAGYVVERLREVGVLAGTDGPGRNVLKLRPPLCLEARDADVLLAALDEVLAEDPAQPE